MSNDLEIYNKILLKDNVKRTFEADYVKSLFKKFTCPQSDIIQFLHQAQLSGANPVLNQIYLVERNVKNKDGSYSKKGTVVYSYNFLLAVAAQTGEFEGYTSEMKVEKRFDPILGKWGNEELSYTVTVKRKNKGEYPYTAYWSEYAQTDYGGKVNSQWASKPHVMLEKCGISGALRRAFPESLSGMYIEDEISEHELQKELEREQKHDAIEAMSERIEQKKQLAEDEDERNIEIEKIRNSMTSITKDYKTIDSKAKAMFDLCGVRQFKDLSTKTLDELKALSNKLENTYSEMLERQANAEKKKSVKDVKFKIEG